MRKISLDAGLIYILCPLTQFRNYSCWAYAMIRWQCNSKRPDFFHLETRETFQVLNQERTKLSKRGLRISAILIDHTQAWLKIWNFTFLPGKQFSTCLKNKIRRVHVFAFLFLFFFLLISTEIIFVVCSENFVRMSEKLATLIILARFCRIQTCAHFKFFLKINLEYYSEEIIKYISNIFKYFE